jgi:hypothetical protein
MTADTKAKWEELLNPALLRSKLISVSIFLAAFEILKESIIGRIKDFFSVGFDINGDIIDPKYRTDVLSRNKSPLYASLSWLEEMKAIDAADIGTFETLKACRNTVAHELPRLVGGNVVLDHLVLFPDLLGLLRKIELWWIVNVEIPTNPDLDGAAIDESGIIPGPVITLRLMTDIAFASEEESTFYFNEFRRLAGNPAVQQDPNPDRLQDH